LNDAAEVYRQTRREYAEKFSLNLSPPLGFSNDFAILVRGDVARKNNLRTVSEAVLLARDWQTGFGQDFMSRADGYAGFSRAYNFDFAKQPREMDLSLTYRALASGQIDLIAGNSTDGLIAALDLFQLADDKKYFPPYQAVFINRSDKSEILSETYAKLENAISTDEMRRLNYAVDGEKLAPRDAAAQWLKEKGF
jgi:glycine betaine/choline ABC-type transport system substrate-binding protein